MFQIHRLQTIVLYLSSYFVIIFIFVLFLSIYSARIVCKNLYCVVYYTIFIFSFLFIMTKGIVRFAISVVCSSLFASVAVFAQSNGIPSDFFSTLLV